MWTRPPSAPPLRSSAKRAWKSCSLPSARPVQPLVEDGRFVLSPSVPGVKAIDPTAAGDSFVGAFCVAVCSGLSSEDALRFANHTAALTVSRLGAMPSLPTLAEVAATMPGGVSGLEG